MKRSFSLMLLIPLSLAATPVEAKVVGKEVAYVGGGAKMKGYLAFDDAKKGKRPGVLVVHEWWGHNDYARRRARMLAEMGYTALAVDMYGDGKNTGHPADAKKFMTEVMSNMKTAEARFKAALALLHAHETTNRKKTAAIGYCFGGAVVLHMARVGMNLRGVASFHGNLATKQPAKAGQVKAEILVLHGVADPFVPAQQVADFTAEMLNAGAKLKLVTYPGAKHAFTNPGASKLGKRFKIPLVYNAQADRQSWAELKRFFSQIL